ncbi:MAG: putative quinol monooxygenase [Paracoccaceae bacterium]
MQTLTAIIRVRAGHEDEVRAALIKVGEYVRANEPETLGYTVAQDPDDPLLFTTFEQFTDEAAMDRHNNGPGSTAFFAVAGPLLDGPATVVTAKQIFSR